MLSLLESIMTTAVPTTVTVSAMGMMPHDEWLSEPTSQMYTLDMVSSSVVTMRNMLIELNRYVTATPTSIRLVGLERVFGESMTIMIMGIKEKMNAFIMTPTSLMKAIEIRLIPRIMETDTPNIAPDEIPVVYGSAKGLCITLCITAPDTPRAAPAITA